MKTDAKRTKPLPEMPFQVDHKLNVDIPTQVTEGLREAILTGYYKPGDALPRIREFTRGLHVSLRALLPAYRTLKKEGWPRHVERVSLDAIVRAAYDLFRARYRTKADLPDAFLFTDDYLARGALLALLAAGIRTGRDVLVIAFANKGTTPLHPDPIDLVLSDPTRNADAIAEALIAYLNSGVAPGTLALGNAFTLGEPPTVKCKDNETFFD